MKPGRILLLVLVLMGFVILFGSRGVLDNIRLQQKIATLARSNEELGLANDALKKEILLLRNDPRYIETVARNELGMVKRSDLVYRRVE